MTLIAMIYELKQICSHFNFSEEMKGTKENLRKEARIIQDLQDKQAFPNTANVIEQLLYNSW